MTIYPFVPVFIISCGELLWQSGLGELEFIEQRLIDLYSSGRLATALINVEQCFNGSFTTFRLLRFKCYVWHLFKSSSSKVHIQTESSEMIIQAVKRNGYS